MGTLQRLTGAPWHVERMVREEGDDRRHRSRCTYYRGKADSYCSFFCGRCRGAAHCEQYKEKESVQQQETCMPINPAKNKILEPFEGVKTLNIKDVHVSDKFNSTLPKELKIKELEDFFKKHGYLDKPIFVSCKSSYYELEDKYLRYYVAKRLGLKEIPAEMGSKDEVKIYDRLRTIGTLVWIKKTSEVGEVIDFNLEKVKIRLDSGKELSYDIHKGISLGSIRIL